MRIPRVWVALPLGTERKVELPASAVRHLLQVLRLRRGDRVVLFNGDGRNYEGKIVAAARGGVTVHLVTAGPPEAPPRLDIRLGLGISKAERMAFALQKATELGVSEITPLFAARTLVRLSGERLDQRLEHWRGILVAACEQCGRRGLPVLATAQPLFSWLQNRDPDGLALNLDAGAPRTLRDLSPPKGAVSLLVGPEGGLSEDEHAQAAAAGFASVRLGPRILRAETAPLAAIAAVQTLWGDFSD